MSSSNTSGSSKSPVVACQSSFVQQYINASTPGDISGQRRSGGSGSFGSGATTRSTATPRNGQASRKQHKASKRFRLADDDDAMAISVSYSLVVAGIC